VASVLCARRKRLGAWSASPPLHQQFQESIWNRYGIENPGTDGPGEFSIDLLLVFYMVNAKVISKIGEYICDDD
jgi:hypothetical protein